MSTRLATYCLAVIVMAAVPLSAQYVVTSLADLPDEDLTDNLYTPPTLRSAIQNANKNGVATSINISPALEFQTITLSSSLPAMIVPVIFEGKGIVISGASSQSITSGLFFTGANSEVRNVKVENINGSGIVWQGSDGLIEKVVVRYCNGPGINLNGAQRNVIGGGLNGYYSNYIYGCTGTGGNGIALITGSSDNEIKYCAIGVNEQYQRASNSRSGILLENARIWIHHNLISGNDWDGIAADGRGQALSLIIEDNLIGTTEQGGDTLSNGGNGISIANSSNDMIRNNVVSGNAGNGIYLATSSTSGTTIMKNRVGTNRSTKIALPNGAGIQLNGSGHTVIDNVVSGNRSNGIGLSANSTLLTGNIVGLDSSQTVVVPNGGSGIHVTFIENSVVGSLDTNEPYNIVAGNGGSGIVLGSATMSGVTVAGNIIGTNNDGSAPFPNMGHGVLVRYNAEDIIITENIIAANDKSGVHIERNVVIFLDTTRAPIYQRPKKIRVFKNEIGVIMGPNTVMRHGGHGVSILNADSIEISKNFIHGCDGDGIHVANDSTRDVLILDNLIGAADGYPDDARNRGHGIAVHGAIGVTVGSPIDPDLANDIYRNDSAGVYVTDSADVVSVYQNHICLNKEGGISLDDLPSYHLVASNDVLDADNGPNHDQNTPQIFVGDTVSGKLRVAGSMNGEANETYRIDVYLAREIEAGKELLVQGCDDLTWFTVRAPASGEIRFDTLLDVANLPARLIENPVVTTTATGIHGTSPFSLMWALPPDDTSYRAIDVVVTIDTTETKVDNTGRAELTAWITNRGFDPAFNVTVTDTIQPNFSGDSLGISKGAIQVDNGVVTATIPSLLPLESVRFRVVGRSLLSGLHVRYVRASLLQWDVNRTNNIDSVELDVSVVNSIAEDISDEWSMRRHSDGQITIARHPAGVLDVECYDLLGRRLGRFSTSATDINTPIDFVVPFGTIGIVVRQGGKVHTFVI